MSENTPTPPTSSLEESSTDRPKQRILIGSQRHPEAYRPKPAVPVVDLNATPPVADKPTTVSADPAPMIPTETDPMNDMDSGVIGKSSKPKIAIVMTPESDEEVTPEGLSEDGVKKFKEMPVRSGMKIPVPNIRGKMSDDLEEEFNALFAGTEMDSLLATSDVVAGQEMIEPDTKLKAKILRLGREQLFLDLGGRNEGALPLKMFPDDAVPQVGDELEVIVIRFEDGLYELTMPLAAADVRDWAQVREGMIVDAMVTKANTGGLEVQVNRLRGFIPISQIAQFRVEKPEEFVGEKLTCIVIECDPADRNLVLSRRAMIEHEREELREKTLADLEVGQVREGVVRKIIDVGAFVDLGGVDGFIHVSGLAWGRVRHPGDVLQEGQRIKVKVTKIDMEKNRISLTYRDDADNPWSNIFGRFEVKSTVRGKVVKVMDFGAFVELVPGVEGLIHISELAHQRVGAVSDVVREGDWVDVLILAIDTESKRIALSLKQTQPEPQREEAVDSGEAAASASRTGKKDKGRKEEIEPVAAPLKIKNAPKGPLKGGIDSDNSEGAKFGLKW